MGFSQQLESAPSTVAELIAAGIDDPAALLKEEDGLL